MRSVIQVAILIFISAIYVPVYASNFAEIGALDALIAQSDVIFIGRVATVAASPRGPAGQPGIHTAVRFEVEEALLGTPTGVVELWIHGGEVNGRRRLVPGQAQFAIGERALVFAFASSTGHLWPSGMARGKWPEVTFGASRFLSPGGAVPLDHVRLRVRARGTP